MQSENKDKIVRFTIADGAVRGLMISSTNTVEKAKEIHNTNAVATAAFGRALTGTVMLTSTLKNSESSVTLTIDGNGPIGKIVCVGQNDTVRGLVMNPYVNIPQKNGKLDVGSAVGQNGRISVVKDINMKTPYIGQTEIQNGEIASDLAYYFTQSEQTPSLVSLGVIASDDNVVSAGGVLLQPLPGCTNETIDTLEFRSPLFGDIANELKYESIEVLINNWFEGLKPVILSESELMYKCYCSKEKTERTIISLGEKEIKKMIAENTNDTEVECHFCNKKYVFTNHDLLRLLNRVN